MYDAVPTKLRRLVIQREAAASLAARAAAVCRPTTVESCSWRLVLGLLCEQPVDMGSPCSRGAGDGDAEGPEAADEAAVVGPTGQPGGGGGEAPERASEALGEDLTGGSCGRLGSCVWRGLSGGVDTTATRA